MSINWSNLRVWNGSQENGFEELCCQLAAAESVPTGSRFFRKGRPDAGVECFWRLPNGDEWAWQAKFFRSSPNPTQWGEIDKSVKDAIEKHPRLTKYTICLPVDRSDARVGRQRSFLTKWDDYVTKWQRLAAKQGMSTAFEYWGQSEIGGHLSNEKHRGCHWFWFNEERFSNSWFASRVEEALDNARDRYTPALNIDLPIRTNFYGLGRTPAFFERLEHLYSEGWVRFKKLHPAIEPKSLKEKYDEISKIARELFGKIEPWVIHDKNYVEWTLTQPIPWNDIGELARVVEKAASECISEICELQEIRKKEKQEEASQSSEHLSWQDYSLRKFRRVVSEIAGYSQTLESKLSNHPALLLVGGAGQGKTHLLCEVAKHDTYESRPRIILHGEQFRNDEPWSQIIRLLGLNCSREDFIGALEAAAQANNCRVLIFIDALNEGEGNRLWWKFLPGMLTTLAQSQWLGICVSVRSSYEKVIIPDSLDKTRILRLEHLGFGEVVYDAVGKFFGHFSIEPSTPVLLPEFDNPLFLKLFCQSLCNAGLKRVPLGLQGITAVFRFFIESIDKKLSRPECLDYDARSRIVAKAVEHIANEMAKRKTDRLPLDETKKLIGVLLPRNTHQHSLFHHLESEGILTVTPDYRKEEKTKWMESVRFTYQRFSDHLITQRLLERHLDKKNPKKSFSSRRPLGKLVKDEQACWRNRGFLEALAIQIPELTKKELPDLAPHLAAFHPIREAFVESIIWRDSNSFSRATNRYINRQVLSYRGTSRDFWNALIMLAPTPNHPFNADRLHAILSRFKLPDRDAWWSVLLHEEWGQKGAIDRLVKWAWEDNDKSVFGDEVIRLSGVTLGWFFTSSNRFLRDRATKAMVRLCENRFHVLQKIIEKFLNVDDPYVMERLYAVAYGSAMRSKNSEQLAGLAQEVYQQVFKSGNPPPHVLLREYARGVIEVALHRGIKVDGDLTRIKPPYQSEWPSFDIPEVNKLKAWSQWKEGMPDVERSRLHLYHSVTGEGFSDFSTYVVGDLEGWSSEKIDEPHKPTYQELHDQFEKSLTGRQRRAWVSYCNIVQNISFYRRLEPDRRKEFFGREFTEEQIDAALRIAEAKLLSTLSKSSKKYRLLRDTVKEYVAEPHKYSREKAFDGQLARRWMMKKIINMGWSVERFGEFDRNVNRYSNSWREAHKPERIGKKYQWIAYHELLARLSDNFKRLEDKWSSKVVVSEDNWSLSLRDVDPSNLLKKTQREVWRPHTNTWWFSTKFDSWEEPAKEVEWLKNNDALPDVRNMIEVVRPEDGSSWLTLNGYYHWEQPIPPGQERYEFKRRRLWYMLKCYLVKKEDSTRLLKWAKKQNWMGRWMPESHESYDIFLGEFFWSPVFKILDSSYYSWQRSPRHGEGKIPAEILVANDEYSQVSTGFDCSIEENIFINLPCRFLLDGMNLNWRGIEGNWYDGREQLIAFDPSVRWQGPGVLLLRRDALLEFLDRQKLTLFWTLLGEKMMIGGAMFREDYKGHLEINGAYILKDNLVRGETHSRYLSYGGERR
jgi:hypothetical protein